MKATMWKNDFERINRNFQNVLKEPLKDGIKILILARINFDLTHGLSLKILDIDPAYTLGDLEREKLETIMQLKKENIFELNKSTKLPLLPQRIAIISVESSKGYADFLKVLEGNPWNYKFFHLLFPSLLQGEKAVPGIIYQLNRIKKVRHHFDVIAIIRGGGGDIGLSCYNDFTLSKAIAEFPLPILTGIGHATNETIVEMVAHTNAITPTKIAEFLLQQFHNFARPVQDAARIVSDKSRRILLEERTGFQHTIRAFRSATINTLRQNNFHLNSYSATISAQARFTISSELRAIEGITKIVSKDARAQLTASQSHLRQLLLTMDKTTAYNLDRERKLIGYLATQLSSRTPGLLKQKTTDLSNIEKNVFNLSPENVMKRGYSITLKNGKAIRHITEISAGDKIETVLPGGTADSTVHSTSSEQ
jgi:exodeoxyribonuclease VII large subunit